MNNIIDNLNSILIQEDTIFNRDIDYLYNYYCSDIYNEKSAISLGIDILDKISRVVFTYIKTLREYLSTSYSRKSYIRLYEKMGETIKKYPDLGNEAIIIPYIKNDEIKSVEDMIDRLTLFKDNRKLYDIVSKYQISRASLTKQPVYKSTVKDLYKSCGNSLDAYDEHIEEIKKDLLSVKRIIQKSKYNNSRGIINEFVDFCKILKESVQHQYTIIVLQTELLHDSLRFLVHKKINNAEFKYVESSTKVNKNFIKSIENDFGKLTYKQTRKIGNFKVRIYESNKPNSSALIYDGKCIIVEKGFFDIPEGMQEAIIYHEIGHYMSGDFGFDDESKYPSERENIKYVKKVKKYFDKEINKSIFKDDYYDIYDSELLYLLGENNADNYSAKFLGKKLVKTTLMEHISDILKNNGYTENNYRFNMDRMKIRTNLIN